MATPVAKNGRRLDKSDAAKTADFTSADFNVSDLSELTILIKAAGGNCGAVTVNSKDAAGNYTQVATWTPAALGEIHTVGAGCSGTGDVARGFGTTVQVVITKGAATSFTYEIQGK